MAARTLDRLVEILQSAVSGAQRTVSARRRGTLWKRVDIDQQGNEEALSYFFSVSLDEPGAGSVGAIRLPLLTLWPLTQPAGASESRAEDSLTRALDRIRSRLTRPQRSATIISFKRPDQKPRG